MLTTSSIPLSAIELWLNEECPGAGPLRERLEAARLSALKNSLNYAAGKSRWYGCILAGCNLDIPSVADLRGLPFTTAANLQDHRQFLCVSQGDVCRIVTLNTSGSTDSPKRIAFSEKDFLRTVSFFRAGMSQLVNPGDKLLVLLGGGRGNMSLVDMLRHALEKSGVEVIGADPTDGDYLKKSIMKVQPDALVAAPSQLPELLRCYIDSPAFRKGTANIHGIQCSGDILENGLRKQVETVLDCAVLDHFGMTETCYGGGEECFARNGYHMRDLDLFFEILHPVTHEPVPDGQVGELVLTTLNREAMPLIRYRTGDAAAWLTGKCACGSSLRRLAPLQGRWHLENGRAILRRVKKGDFNARNAAETLFRIA